MKNGLAMVTHRDPGRGRNTNQHYTDNGIQAGCHCQERRHYEQIHYRNFQTPRAKTLFHDPHDLYRT